MLLAALILLPTLAFAQVADTPTWQIDAGGEAYLPAAGDNVRGAAVNPATGHLLVASRATGDIKILDATDGSLLGALDMTDVAGGIYAFNEVAVTDGGVIYTANLDLDGANGGVKVYRWADESAAPMVVFDGATNVAGRTGDALGASTGDDDTDYVFLSGSGSTNITVFAVAESDETAGAYVATIAGDLTVASGAARGGIAAYVTEDDDQNSITYVAINGFGTPTQLINLDDPSETYTIATDIVPAATMDVDAVSSDEFAYLAVGPGANEEFYVVDVSDPSDPLLIATTPPVAPETPNPNTQKLGAATFDTVNGQLIGLSTNNAIAAFGIAGQVQFVHNSSFAAMPIDIYVNGELVADDLDYREATTFLDIPALANIGVAVTLGDAANGIDDAFYSIAARLGLEGPVVVVAHGDPGSTDENDAFDFEAFTPGQMMAEDDTMVDLLIYHGSPDAGDVSVGVRGSDDLLVEGLEYTYFAEDYVSVAPALYVLQVRSADTGEVGAEYVAALEGAAGGAAVVLATGFDDSDDEDAPEFGLLIAYPDGTTAMLPRLVSIADAREASGADLAVEGIVTRARGRISYIQDAPVGSDDDPDALAMFSSGGSYFDAIANGDLTMGDEIILVGRRSDFNDLQQINPDTFYVQSRGNMLPEPQLVTLADLAANGEDYESELVRIEGLSINADGDEVFQTGGSGSGKNYAISQGETEEGEVVLRITRNTDSQLEGVAIPAVADFTGIIGDFRGTYQLFPILLADLTEAAPGPMAQVQLIHNSADPSAATIDVSVNGATLGEPGYLDDVDYQTATGYMMLPAGETTLAVLSADGATELFSETVMLEADMSYVAVAAGKVADDDDDSNDFGLFGGDGMPMASGQTTVDVQIFHGTYDAPSIDVRVVESAMLLADDLSFGEFEDYQSLPAAEYTLDVEAADGSAIVSRFSAPLTSFAQKTVTVLATGLLTNEVGAEQTFGLLAVDELGNAMLLPLLSGTDAEVSETPVAFALRGAFPNPSAGQATLAFDLPSAGEVSVDVYDVMGRHVLALPARAFASGAAQSIALDAGSLAAGTYLFRVTAELGSDTQVRTGRLTLVR